MAYNANYLHAAPFEFGAYANRLWKLETLDGLDTIEGAGYISNARSVGMKPGDAIFVTRWTTALPSPVTPADGTATPLTGSGSIAGITIYWCRGLTAAGAAVLSDDLTTTLAATAE